MKKMKKSYRGVSREKRKKVSRHGRKKIKINLNFTYKIAS